MIVPLKLDNPLNGAHGHWSSQARARKGQRQMIKWRWIADAMPRKLLPGERVLITRVGKRKLDSDNLQAACKSVRDAVAEMLGINDSLDVWDYEQRVGDYAVEIKIILPLESLEWTTAKS